MNSNPMKAADLLVKALEHEGVEMIFGLPGEENLDFLAALEHSRIRFILTRHEQGAAFMAATYGRLTGKPGVCLSTLGPGATNLVTGVAYAQLGAMPMIVLTGQKPIKKSKQGRFQILDVVSMMRPLTKFTHQIVEGATIPSLVREAFHLSQAERPGPVHLELPEDIASEMVSDTHLYTVNPPKRPIANEQSIDDACEMIRQAKKPLLLVGAGANRKWICSTLKHFVDETGIPFFNTQMGKGVISGEHPLFMGTAALSDNDFLHLIIEQADLIINAGHDIIEKPPFFMHEGGKQVIHVNFTPAQTDMVYFPQLEVIGDIANSMERIGKKLGKTKQHDFSCFLTLRKAIEKHIHESDCDPRFPMVPQRVVSDLRKALNKDALIALDNGMYKIWFARNYVTYYPNSVLLDNALATMGAGLSSAMMAAMLYPKKQVVAVCGDGGFMMNSQELETAQRLQLNLVVLLLRDDAYGMIRWKQAMDDFNDFGLQFTNPDFIQYTESFGAKAHRIQALADFIPVIQDCFKAGGLHLVEVPIDYSENMKVLGHLSKTVSDMRGKL